MSVDIEGLKNYIGALFDHGAVTSPAVIGTNILHDDTKRWEADALRNKYVKIVAGYGVGQLRQIQGNSNSSIVIRGTWAERIDALSKYVILDTDLDLALQGRGGTVYVNSDTAVNDNPRRFTATSLILKEAVISVATNDQLFGNGTAQLFPLAAAGDMAISAKFDLSGLYFRNRNAGQNGTVYILGIQEES